MRSWGWGRGVVVAAAIAALVGNGGIGTPASARDGAPERAGLYQSVTVDLEADQHLVVTCTGVGSGYLASVASRWEGTDWGSRSLGSFGAGRGPVVAVAAGDRTQLDPEINAWDVNFTIGWGGPGSPPARGTVAWALFHAQGTCTAAIDGVGIAVSELDRGEAIAAYAEDFSGGLGVEAADLVRVAENLELTVDTAHPTYYWLDGDGRGEMQLRVTDADGVDAPLWDVDADPGRRTFHANGTAVGASWPLLILLQLPS